MRRLPLLLLAALGLAASRPAAAQVGAGTTLFDKGRTRGSVGLGWGQAFDRDYLIVTGGFGYNVARGTELELDGEIWTANHPAFQKLTPGIRYVFTGNGKFYPYIGAFYQHVFYEDFPDADALGARAGLYAPVGGNAYVGGGLAVTHDLECEERAHYTCTQVYPELSLNFAF
jgi:hypothetical protein